MLRTPPARKRPLRFFLGLNPQTALNAHLWSWMKTPKYESILDSGVIYSKNPKWTNPQDETNQRILTLNTLLNIYFEPLLTFLTCIRWLTPSSCACSHRSSTRTAWSRLPWGCDCPPPPRCSSAAAWGCAVWPASPPSCGRATGRASSRLRWSPTGKHSF